MYVLCSWFVLSSGSYRSSYSTGDTSATRPALDLSPGLAFAQARIEAERAALEREEARLAREVARECGPAPRNPYARVAYVKAGECSRQLKLSFDARTVSKGQLQWQIIVADIFWRPGGV